MVVLCACPPTAPPPGDSNRPARKYCLRATCKLTNATGQTIGMFTSYDKSIEVAAQVEAACDAHRSTLAPGCECGSVELVFLEDCPSECTDSIMFRFT